MLTIAGLGLRALMVHRRLVVMMSLTVAISLAAFLILHGYRMGLIQRYSNLSPAFLLVEQSGSMAEFYGSRIPADVGRQLLDRGASRAIPEIHSIVGTTPQNAVLLRGVSLEEYAELESFRMVSGRPLQPGDLPRRAMIGVKLAEERGAGPGETIQIRGRDFLVSGVFAIGSYADFEAWIALEDAQALMGWGTDVSVFVIPAGEALRAGDELPGGLSVVQKGESGANLIYEWQPLFDLLDLVTAALGAAAAVTLANVLGRLVWLNRRDMAILLSLGFSRPTLAGYLLVQGSAIGVFGYLTGCAAALGLSAATKIQTAAISIQAVFDADVLANSLLFTLSITLAGSILPVFWFIKTNLAALLRADT
jgi:ABC-type lipoprotein release transport system permease subunit